MFHTNILLSTSNKRKIEEFKSFNLDFEIVKGADLKEIKSDYKNVIVHKSIDAGEDILVEDTVLIVNGEEIVDIRWKIDELKDLSNPIIEWVTSLAIVDRGWIFVYEGRIKCKLVDEIATVIVPDDAFGFDPYLVPDIDGVESTFYELEKLNLKSNYSPRKMAVDKILVSDWVDVIDIDSVEPWKGEYQ